MPRAWPRIVDAGSRVGRVLAMSADRYFADRCSQQAAGIAYRVLFSIVPLAIVLVSVFGVILGNDEVHNAVVDAIAGALPSTAAHKNDVADAIDSIAAPSGLIGLVTLLVFAWSATGMMTAIRIGLDVATQAGRSRPMARGKLVDLALVVGVALLVLSTVALTVLDRLAQHALRRIESALGLHGGALGVWMPRIAAVVVSWLILTLIYRFVPTRRLRLADAIAGGVTTSVLLMVISLASSRIYASATSLSIVYGSLTAALVFLYSVYLYASALLFGGEVAAAWSAPAEPGGDPLRVQLRRAVRGLFISNPPPDRR